MLKRPVVLLSLFVPFLDAAGQTRSFAGRWLRPAPAPVCRDFLVTEASAEFRLNHRENQENPRFILGLGFMHNDGSATSKGAVVAWDVGRGWARPARAEFRYRRWLAETAVDLSAGVAQQGLVPSSGNGELGKAYGPTLGAGVEWKYIALDARGELLHGARQTRGDMYLGARTTSAGAPLAVLASLALIVAVVSQAGY